MLFVPAPHPPEFRRRAVDLARSCEQRTAVIAKELGISESCLRNWIAQADADDGKSTARLSSDEKAELAELRKKLAVSRSRTRFSSVPRRTSRGRTSSQS